VDGGESVGVLVAVSVGSDSAAAVDVDVGRVVAVNVGVKVAVKTIVGVRVAVRVLVGVVVSKTSTGSNIELSNISAVSDWNVSMNAADVNSGVVSRMPTKFLTGTVSVSSNIDTRAAALDSSVLATVTSPDAASAI
jgi:hypothetical protein